MQFFNDLFTNYHLMSAVCGWLLAQILKVFTGVFRQREFSLRAMFFGNGGMPSSHTAAVAALMVATAVTEGVNSAIFAVTALLCIIVMNDATGVRRETGKHSRLLNRIMEERSEMQQEAPQKPIDLFRELMGHSPLQVFFGLLTGVVVALLLSFLPAFGG